MNEYDDFVEVNNQLPYKQILQLQIINVKLEANKFNIDCKYRVENTSQEQLNISRSFEDITWLIDNIFSNKKTYLSPKINNPGYLELLYKKMATNQALRIEGENRLSQRLIKRALVIITTIILPHLKSIGKQYAYPVFIFFNQKFGLYKNPIYYKEDTIPITERVGKYFWNTYAQLTSKSSEWMELDKEKQSISNQMQLFDKTRSKLEDYTNMLYKLQDQFIGQKEIIKNQLGRVEKLLIKYEGEVKYLQLVLQQAKSTLIRIQNKTLVQVMMNQYASFLKQEVKQASEKFIQLIKQYVKVMCDQEQRIKVAPH